MSYFYFTKTAFNHMFAMCLQKTLYLFITQFKNNKTNEKFI
jgi:hypothetical protein